MNLPVAHRQIILEIALPRANRVWVNHSVHRHRKPPEERFIGRRDSAGTAYYTDTIRS